jgi:mono/diheme cytochrome c family protein
MKKSLGFGVAVTLVSLLTGGAFAQTGWGPVMGSGKVGPTVSPPSHWDVLRQGRRVYAVNCAICHGVNGDGNGMATHMLRTRPRDFQRGVFKFRSTPSGSLPTDHDLVRTVTEGVRWTGMVGRRDLSEQDRNAVVQYLKTFSPRFADEQPQPPVPVSAAPLENRELLELGGRLYRDAGCDKCHGEQGRGDGPSASGMKDERGRPDLPSDLTWRPLKRSSTSDEIYLTIATGLAETAMPSYGDSLDSRDIWALVYYLDSLVPAERRLPPMQALGEEAQGWMAVVSGRAE